MTAVSTGYVPHLWQAEIHDAMRRFSVLVCHRRFGKTVLAINSLIDAALRHDGGDGRFAYVAPYRNQAKSIAWDYLRQFTQPVLGMKYNEGELSVEMSNGSRIRLFGADNADALRGLYFDGVVLDEVADMKPNVWGEVVRPALADRRGWCLFIGTPKGVNQFYELYDGASNGWRQPDGSRVRDKAWYASVYTVDDTEVLDRAELDMARATMTDSQYRQEFLCDFSASCDNVLITIDTVADAVRRKYQPRDLYGAPKVLGVDVARFGGDRSCIIRRHGQVVFDPKIYNGIDNMELVGLVAQEIQEFQPDAVFIDGGRGEGVIDRLRQLGYSIIEVNFGGSAVQKGRYANKRTEMWDSMRQWLVEGGQLPDNLELKRDLVTPTYSFDAANRMVLEPKDKIKERGLPSPDVADAAVVTFAFPVNVVRKSGLGRHASTNTAKAQTKYELFA